MLNGDGDGDDDGDGDYHYYYSIVNHMPCRFLVCALFVCVYVCATSSFFGAACKCRCPNAVQSHPPSQFWSAAGAVHSVCECVCVCVLLGATNRNQ